jgi:hypothetical protein
MAINSARKITNIYLATKPGTQTGLFDIAAKRVLLSLGKGFNVAQSLEEYR